LRSKGLRFPTRNRAPASPHSEEYSP
jgi:hypothetical protein